MASISGTNGSVPMDVDAPPVTRKRPSENNESSPSKAQKVASGALSAAPVLKSPINWSAHMAELHFGCTGLPSAIQNICQRFLGDTDNLEEAHAESEKGFLFEIAQNDFMKLAKYQDSLKIACQDENWVYSVLKTCRPLIEEDREKNSKWDFSLEGDGAEFRVYPSKDILLQMLRPHSNHKKIMLLAIEMDGSFILHTSNDLKNDEEIALTCIRSKGNVGESFQYLGDTQRNNPKVLFEALQLELFDGGANILEHTDAPLKNDRDFFVKLFKSDKEFPGLYLYQLEEALRDDEEIVFLAVTRHKKSIEGASERLQNDEQFITRLIEAGAAVSLGLAPIKYRDQEKFVERFLTASYDRTDDMNEPKYMSDRLKNDKRFILSLIEKGVETLDLLTALSPNLRNDKDVVRQYFIHHGTIYGASEDLQNDRDFILSLINEKKVKRELHFDQLFSNFRDDKEIVLAILRRSGQFVASERLKNDPELARLAISSRPYHFNFLSIDLRNNPEIQAFALNRWPNWAVINYPWGTDLIEKNPFPQ
jgi:hypothetical protein